MKFSTKKKIVEPDDIIIEELPHDEIRHRIRRNGGSPIELYCWNECKKHYIKSLVYSVCVSDNIDYKILGYRDSFKHAGVKKEIL